MKTFRQIRELVVKENIDHSRYKKAHDGKKAKGNGVWMFTTKSSGDVDFNNDKEVFQSTTMSLQAAGKAAMKALGVKKVYVMEAFKPYMNKETPRIVDFYIQFRGGKGDWITSPDNKKDYEKALKLTQDFMRKNKIKTKLETGTPEQGSSAYKISLILNKNKPEYRVDLRPLVDQISKFKTAEDHGGGYDKPLKEFRMPPMTMANEGKKFDKAYDAWHKSTVQLTRALEKDAGNKSGVSKFKKALQDIENAIDASDLEESVDEALKLTNIIRTHKGIEYRNVGSSIHQAFWDGYDNVKSRKGTILFSVWKEGRAAAKQGLYRGVSKLKPPHAKKER